MAEVVRTAQTAADNLQVAVCSSTLCHSRAELPTVALSKHPVHATESPQSRLGIMVYRANSSEIDEREVGESKAAPSARSKVIGLRGIPRLANRLLIQGW